MRCVEDPDPATFRERVRPLLTAEPIFTNVMATVLASPPRPAPAPARWLRVHDEGLAGAAIWTPPHGVLLSPMTVAAAAALADHLGARGDRPPSADGPSDAVAAFVERYTARTGVRATRGMAQRLYRLNRVEHPAPVPGRPRPATPADRDLILDWLDAFLREAEPRAPRDDRGPLIDQRLAVGHLLWLWEVDRRPVSFCLHSPVSDTLRISRVGMVYTPPEFRGHGYASGNVAAASQHALDQGADACMLYTDLANPTSNHIYQKLGYRPVGDAQQWWFS
jgi:RimJ/RimL family protein N-acetyltransferase